MVAGVAGGLVLTPPQIAAVAQTPPTPTVTAQAAAVKICSGCHTMQVAMDTPKDYDAWHETVQEMINRGAQGTQEDFDLVMQFLFENMTTVDVNHDDQEALATVLHTSTETANTIIAHRAMRPFKDLNELENTIPGLDRALLESKRKMIFFQ
jgi:competence protein ComEA